MDLIKVENSGNIAFYGYDKDERTLQIRFHEGTAYEYLNFPKEMWLKFQQSESKGKFAHQFIYTSYVSRKLGGWQLE